MHSTFGRIDTLLVDWDGTLTDGRIWISAADVLPAYAAVSVYARDAAGLDMLRRAGVRVVILTRSSSWAPRRLADHLGVGCCGGVWDKRAWLHRQADIDPCRTAAIGDDVHDLDLLEAVRVSAAPADAHPRVLRAVDLVLSRPAGAGAVREMCDMILQERTCRE